jgi:hypothetical protein
VFHAVETLGFAGALRDAPRWGQCVRVIADHPQAREMLHLRLFWNVWHYLLVRSALALLGPAWLRRIVIARHLSALRARGRACGAGSWCVPLLLAVDAVETAAIVRAALRARTLVI